MKVRDLSVILAEGVFNLLYFSIDYYHFNLIAIKLIYEKKNYIKLCGRHQ